ncbi:MAG: ribosome maturation protein [Candidatus Woesearchaeota archaeon]|nr:ribosome maturation protein [Candidatus Woesearchaeota archaeon]MDN5327661.1 ribosome maturation protein [Candidatus Woesearchaeota archaeon]
MSFDPEKGSVSFNLARLKKGKHTFEVVIDPEMAIKLKHGENIDVSDAVKSLHIFYDAHKGLLASEHVLEEVFGTSDPEEVARKIIEEGEIHLTTKQREEIRERKLRQIIDYIHTNAIDPRTGLPIPPARIEAAIKEAKVHIDPTKRVDRLVKEVVEKIKLIMPLRFEQKILQITLNSQYAAKVYGILKELGELSKEQWLSDGSFMCELTIPAGRLSDVIDKLNDLTHGSVEINVLGAK